MPVFYREHYGDKSLLSLTRKEFIEFMELFIQYYLNIISDKRMFYLEHLL